MRKLMNITLILVAVYSLATLTACSDDDDSEISTKTENVRYYVKYEASFQTQHVNTGRYITYTDEKGKHDITLSEWNKVVEWNGTYGPVDKNFVASLDCSTANYDGTVIHARIYVSRDKEPFVIKAEGNNENGRPSLSLSYKIDF